MPIRRPITCLLLAGTALAALAQPALAQSWDGSDNSNVNDPDNWSGNAVPATNGTVSINDGTVTIQPVLAAGEELNVRSVNVGADGGIAPLLTVNGILGLSEGPNGGTLNIASAANNLTGTVLVSGAGARIGPSPGSTSGIGVRVGTTLGSDGTLRIENGGTGGFQSLQIGNGVPSAAGVGLVEVIGAGSLLEITSGAAGLNIGNRQAGGGVGTLRILGGAAFTTPGGVGSVLGLGSSILVSGADAAGNGSRFIVPTQLLMIGSSFTVEDGAQAEIAGFILEGDATLRLLDGGTLSSLGGAIGSSPFAVSNVTAIVSGAGSRWTSTPTNGGLTIGNTADGVGTLEVLDGGEVDFNSTLTLATGSSLRVAGTDAAGVNARLAVIAATGLGGDILIEDGGIASFQTLGLSNTGTLTVTAGGLAQVEQTSTFSIAQQAEVLISGAGAEIRSTGGLSLVNNAVGTPTADFIIEDGARLELNGTVGAGVTFSQGNGERRNLIVRDGSELEIINSGFGFLGNNGGVFVEGGSQVITQGSWTLGGASELSITGGSRMQLNGGANSTFSPETDILLSGAGSLLDIAANISLGGGNPGGGTVVITDGATLRTRGPSDNGLGFNGVLRTVEITDGGSWIMTGGANAGLQIETTDLLVDGGTLFAEGIVTIGQRFTGTTLTLLDSDFAARQLEARSGSDTIINLGGTRTSAAGSVGEFDVGTVFVGSGNALVINHNTANFEITSVIGSGTGSIEHLAGDTIFSGSGGGFGGELAITGGRVQVDGTLGGMGMQTDVSGGARLSGTGTIGGNVAITNGTLAAGNSPGTLTIGGALTLGGASTLQFELGAPGSTAGIDGDLINVGGDLTLDGTLDITDLGGFGTGLYRLINYGGTLTDNGLAFGTVPAGFEDTGLMLDVATAGQINLLATAPEPDFDFIFWDGAATTANGLIDGGSGTWSTTNTNWTTLEADNNGAFDPADFLIFRAPEENILTGLRTTAAVTPSSSTGLVTIDNGAGQVELANGAQFATTGYTITGGALGLGGSEVVLRVGDGSSAGQAMVATIAAPVIGTARLIKTDLGALILSGANTYSGGTRVAGGLLQGNATSLQGAIEIETAGTLLFDQQANGSYAGSLSGAGALVKEGAGALTLSGASQSFAGSVDHGEGTLLVNGTLGNAASTLLVSAGSTLGGTGTFGGSVSMTDGILAPGETPGTSPGTLSISGGLTLAASSILTYELGAPQGGTGAASDLVNIGSNLVLDGTLNVTAGTGFGTGLYRLFNYGGSLTDNGLAIGSISPAPTNLAFEIDTATSGQVNFIALAPDFEFIFWDGAATTANGLIDGGSGTWNTTNTNWTTLEADNNGAFDPADFLIFRAPEQAPGESVSIVTTAAATSSSSTGLVTVDNAGGQVRLANGVQFATTGYTVSGGPIVLDAPDGPVTVRVGDGSTAGAAFVATVGSVLSGQSGLAKTDLGTLILTGANTYTGGTQVNGGTLQGDTTSLQRSFTIAEGANLLFNQTAAGTFAGTILGDGNVLKQGSGTLTLSGMSAAFNGDTRLEAGGINLAGSLGGLLTTLAGTTLSGTGQVESLDLSGTIAPGNSIGTLDINGTAIFRAGSTYQVELAANGTGDRILVDDTVRIEGGTLAISLLDPELNYVDGTSWTILEAEEGLTGTFDGLVETSAFLDFTLGYTAETAFLTLALVRMFPDVAQTFNQQQASTALMALDRTAGADSLAVYNALLLLDDDSARAAFDITSGEIYADVLAGGQRSAQARGAQMLRRGQEVGKPGWDAWMAAGLGRARIKGDGNGARFTQGSEALELGLDYHGPDNAYAAGISGGWQQADLANATRQSSAAMDGFFLGGFARYGDHGKGFTAAAAVSYGEMDGSASRDIAFGAIARSASSAIDTSSTAYALDLRYGFGDSLVIGPSVGLEHGESRLKGLRESGAEALNLSSAGAEFGRTRYGAGGFVSWQQEGSRLLFDLRYARSQSDDTALVVLLEGSDQSFRVLPARGSKDGALAAGSAAFDLGGNLSVGADGSAFLAGDESAVTLSAWLRYGF